LIALCIYFLLNELRDWKEVSEIDKLYQLNGVSGHLCCRISNIMNADDKVQALQNIGKSTMILIPMKVAF
jgi:hypothetical protein